MSPRISCSDTTLVARPSIFLLRLVDHRQPRHHRGKGFVGFLEAFVEPFGHLAGDFVEAAIDGLRQLLHALVEVGGHAFQRVLQQALLGPPLLDQLFQHRGLELAELAGDGFARFRQPLGLRHLQGRQLGLHAVGLLRQASVQIGQHGAVAGFHVLRQQGGQACLLAAHGMEAQQQKDRYQDEGGKTNEEADFNRAHGADFTRDAHVKNPARSRVFIE